MEIIEVTESARFARVRLGDIKPNRFRNTNRWPLEREVIDKLVRSINETGFWNNLQAIENERGEVELRFGHHRLAAGLELFGPDYEVAIEIVPYRGEWNLQRALLMENSIGRNKIMHTHEIVHQLMHWWDDSVFERYPTWWECIESDDQAVIFTSLDLESYFGNQNENGPGHYAQSVKYGIGREVIAKMLDGAENQSDIQEALAALEPTDRRKRGMELKAAEERAKAEAERAEAERMKAEQEARRLEAEREERERRIEIERLAEEQRRIEAAARQSREADERQRLVEQAQQRERELEEKRRSAEELHERSQREHQARQKIVSERETRARQADIRATQKERAIERREWYDARASEVFDRPAHGAAFRRAVSGDHIKPFLNTEDLLPFAVAIKSELERRAEQLGREMMTADNITLLVSENFRTFKTGIKALERIETREREAFDPVSRIVGLIKKSLKPLQSASDALNSLALELRRQEIRAVDDDMMGVEFARNLKLLEKSLAEFKRIFRQSS